MKWTKGARDTTRDGGKSWAADDDDDDNDDINDKVNNNNDAKDEEGFWRGNKM